MHEMKAVTYLRTFLVLLFIFVCVQFSTRVHPLFLFLYVNLSTDKSYGTRTFAEFSNFFAGICYCPFKEWQGQRRSKE